MHNNSTRTVHTAKLTIFAPKGEFSWQCNTIYKRDRGSNLLSAVQYQFLSATQYQILSAVLYQILSAMLYQFLSAVLYQILSAMLYQFLSAVLYQILSAMQYQFLSALRHHFLSATQHATSLLKPRTPGKLRHFRVHGNVNNWWENHFGLGLKSPIRESENNPP